MAVRHGYGKLAGTDALVFAYDAGDTINSYKGEPTVNLASTEISRTLEQYLDSVVIPSEAPERGPGWKKVTITSRGTNFRTAKFPYITQPTNTVRTYSLEIDFNGTSGYYIRGDGFTGFGGNLYTSGIYSTTITTTTNSGPLALFLNNAATSVTGINDIIYYRYYQVEDKLYRTQFTTGTRSATQGLLDLTGKGTINLTNTSFNANAQPFFDGVDDRIVVPYSGTDLNGDPLFTVEGIFKRTGASMSARGFWGLGGDISDQGISGYTYGGSGNNIAIDLWGRKTYRTGVDYPLNQYVHVVWVKSAPTFTVNTVAIYINGVEYTGASFIVNRDNAATVNLNTGNVGRGISIGRIGSQTNTYYGVGEVPVFKVYNKALTVNEINNNYNHYKTRFNL
jgi:hypothetical protein